MLDFSIQEFRKADLRHLLYTTSDPNKIHKKEFTISNGGQLRETQNDIPISPPQIYRKFACKQMRDDISYTCVASSNGPLLD